MRFTIRRKLVLFLVVPILVIFGVVIGWGLVSVEKRSVQEVEKHTAELAAHYASELDGRFDAAAQIARSTAIFLAADDRMTADDLFTLLRSNVETNPLVFGAAIAFAPGKSPNGQTLYSPYVYRDNGGLAAIDIAAESYDYTSGDWEWWSAPVAAGKAMWTRPYFDEGAGNILMATYSSPFYRDGELIGVATVDIPLTDLQELAGIADLESLDFAIIGRGGEFITHPDPAQIMVDDVFTEASRLDRPDLLELGQRVTAGERGVARLPDWMGTDRRFWVFFAPIKSTGWSFVTRINENEALGFVHSQLLRMTLSGLVALALIIVCVWWVADMFSRPIRRLDEAVSRVAEGNLDVEPVDIRSHDEIGGLGEAFNAMVTDLRRNVNMLAKEQAAREAVEGELEAARKIQSSLLPQTFPPYPHRQDFDLHATLASAKAVAGDFFDFLLIDDHTLFIVIADVSGKGVPAALFMAVARTLMRNFTQVTHDPGEILNRCNKTLEADNAGNMFVTVFMGFYDTRDGTLRYANAAHPPPYRIDAQGRVTPFGEVTGTLLGILPEQTFETRTDRLEPGDRLLLYTDGVTEAQAPDGRFLRPTGVEAMLRDIERTDATGMCDQVQRRVDTFQHGVRHDDVTVMCLIRSGVGGGHRGTGD